MEFLTSRRFIGAAILILWAATIALPGFSSCRPGYDHVGGWFLLAFGWMGLIVFQPAWLANFFIVGAGIALFFRYRPPVLIGVLAGGLAACAWGFKAWADDTGDAPICHYHAGYWLWLAVAAVVLFVPFVVRMDAKA